MSESVEKELNSLVPGSSPPALVPGLGSDGRLAQLGKEHKANGPVPELGEGEPQAIGNVSASVEEEVNSLVPGLNSSALVPGLGSDGRLTQLGKAHKANEPVPEIGEKEPKANEHVPASVEEEYNSLVSGSSFPALVPGPRGDSLISGSDSSALVPGLRGDSQVSGTRFSALMPGKEVVLLFSVRVLRLWCLGKEVIRQFPVRVQQLWCLG